MNVTSEKNSEKYIVSSSPHILSGNSTRRIMLFVIIAMLPANIMGVIYFGLSSLITIAISVISAVGFEALFNVITKKRQTISDLSAVVTGLLLAMNVPPNVPFYIPLIGSFVAIVIVKMLFGGIGQNFANPAITARLVLVLSFSSEMTAWVSPFWYKNSGNVADAISTITPLAAQPILSENNLVLPYSFSDMFFGLTGGCFGETCALALILGGLFLIVTKVISPSTPIAYIGTFAILSYIYSGSLNFTIFEVLGGGLLIGAFFMATDYSTTPLTIKGKIIFGVGCAVITFVIRNFGSLPEGVSFAILFMNLLTPYIDKLCKIAPLGTKKSPKEAK